MSDPTEDLRRELVAQVNSGELQPDGKEWTTEQLVEEFEAIGFMAPFVVVRRRSDGKKGSLMFRHSPRIYFGWQEDK